MDNVITAVRSPRGGLLSCLVGTLCVIASYFCLPLFGPPVVDLPSADDSTLAAWGLVWGAFKHALAQREPTALIVAICSMLLPLVVAAILGILTIGRVVMLRPLLARVFLVLYVLGAVPVVLCFIFIGPSGALRAGFFVGILGYALLLAGDLAFRRAAAQPACPCGPSSLRLVL